MQKRMSNSPASATDIGWELYRSYLAVLEHGSLSAAARALALTQPTVGRHVAALEARLGLPLFTRAPTGLLPTEAAQELRPYAETMRSQAAALRRAAAGHGRTGHGDGIRGTVRISASEMVAVAALPAIVARLRVAHPLLTIELDPSNKLQDLLKREADIAVRMTAPRQEQLIARKVGRVALGLHARRDYLAARGRPARMGELAGHSLIGFDAETPFLRAVAQKLGFDRAMLGLRCNSDPVQYALIRAGCGIGLCQVALARQDPALERVLADEVEIGLETWVTMHEDLRGSARCRVAFDALVEGLGDYLAAA